MRKFRWLISYQNIIEPQHEISNNVVCATNKVSDQPAHMCSLDSTSTKQRIKCLAQGHNTVPSVSLEPATPQSEV